MLTFLVMVKSAIYNFVRVLSQILLTNLKDRALVLDEIFFDQNRKRRFLAIGVYLSYGSMD